MSSTFRIAVVGANATGLYASDLLLQCPHVIHVDLINDSPVPAGISPFIQAPRSPHSSGSGSSIRVIGNIHPDVLAETHLEDYYDSVIIADFADAADVRDAVLAAISSPSDYSYVRKSLGRKDLVEALRERGIVYTLWADASSLSTGRDLDAWQRAIHTAQGAPICF
ncbi:oxidoreductase [Corynebacterium ulcerans]|uniref:oxidoreductase n=1 Tax=Corynebacterium ulcerans TaxID=65058 RepID=UPI000C7580C7|nr:oxidoreductase [Corynebacterium ulcerans]PLW02903.1 oxidoreductase [Corynebacterium ulcerans]